MGESGSDDRRDAGKLPSALEAMPELESIFRDRRPGLFLDYDGTLTPIVSQPEDALLSGEMRDVLRRLAELCTVAIVSGRDRADVQPLVGLDELVYAGSHGFDIAGPNGLRMEHEGGRERLSELDGAERELASRLEGIAGARVERKRFAIAVHYRNVAEGEVPKVERAVNEVVDGHDGLRLSGGKKVFELRPDIDWDKGRAILWLLEALDLEGDAVLPVYLGDDVTDEDAFRVLRGTGIGVVVGRPPYPTYASYALRDTREVRVFLQRLVGVLGGDGR